MEALASLFFSGWFVLTLCWILTFFRPTRIAMARGLLAPNHIPLRHARWGLALTATFLFVMAIVVAPASPAADACLTEEEKQLLQGVVAAESDDTLKTEALKGLQKLPCETTKNIVETARSDAGSKYFTSEIIDALVNCSGENSLSSGEARPNCDERGYLVTQRCIEHCLTDQWEQTPANLRIQKLQQSLRQREEIFCQQNPSQAILCEHNRKPSAESTADYITTQTHFLESDPVAAELGHQIEALALESPDVTKLPDECRQSCELQER